MTLLDWPIFFIKEWQYLWITNSHGCLRSPWPFIICFFRQLFNTTVFSFQKSTKMVEAHSARRFYRQLSTADIYNTLESQRIRYWSYIPTQSTFLPQHPHPDLPLHILALPQKNKKARSNRKNEHTGSRVVFYPAAVPASPRLSLQSSAAT